MGSPEKWTVLKSKSERSSTMSTFLLRKNHSETENREINDFLNFESGLVLDFKILLVLVRSGTNWFWSVDPWFGEGLLHVIEIYLATVTHACNGNSQSTELTKMIARKWSFLIKCFEKRKLDHCSLCQGQITINDELLFRGVWGKDKNFVSCMNEGLTEYGLSPFKLQLLNLNSYWISHWIYYPRTRTKSWNLTFVTPDILQLISFQSRSTHQNGLNNFQWILQIKTTIFYRIYSKKLKSWILKCLKVG